MEEEKTPVKKKKKSSSVTNFIFGFIVFVGICIVAYPKVSDWWNKRHATQSIATYVEAVNNLSDAAAEEMLREADAFNRDLGTGIHVGLTPEEEERYYSILDITGTGIMGYIEIPEINVNLPIYHGTDESILEIAVGHVAGSSFPVGGDGVHAALSGHRGLPSASLFTDLDELKEGDIFIVTVLNRKLVYKINQIRIVLPEDVSDLAIEAGHDYATLITCTPYGVNSHRMLVRGTRIDGDEAEEISIEAEARKISPTLVVLGIAVPLIMIFMVIAVISSGINNKRKRGNQLLSELEDSSNQSGGDSDEE